jgi:WD40 repeat protein
MEPHPGCYDCRAGEEPVERPLVQPDAHESAPRLLSQYLTPSRQPANALASYLVCEAESSTDVPSYRVVVSSDAQTPDLEVLDIASSELVRTFKVPRGAYDFGCLATFYALSPDGVSLPRIVMSNTEGHLRIWGGEENFDVRFYDGCVCCIHVYCEPETAQPRIVTGAEGGVVKLWDAETGGGNFMKEVGRLPTAIWALTDFLSVDGRQQVVAADKEGNIRAFDLASGRATHDLVGHALAVVALIVFTPSWEPHHPCIVSGSHDRTAKLWDAETGKMIHSLEGHTGLVFTLATYKEPVALRDRIITGSSDGTIMVWDAQDGTPLHTLIDQQRVPYMALYESAEGLHRLASCSVDQTLQVFDPETGRLLHDVSGGWELKGNVESDEYLTMDGRNTWIWGMETGLIAVWDLGEAPASGGTLRAANKRG